MAHLATPFSWAQRKEKVFISVHLRDIKDEKIDLTTTSLTFNCSSDGKDFTGSINFYEEIDVESSKKTILGYGAKIVLFKKNVTAHYWPRLTKEGGKHNNVTIDWERYIDSDEEGEEGHKGLGQDWDPSAMQNFGGPQGVQEDDSDDDEQAGQNVNDLDDEEEIPAQQEETSAKQQQTPAKQEEISAMQEEIPVNQEKTPAKQE